VRISIFGKYLVEAQFYIPSPRSSGERDRKRGNPPLPDPLIHKSVEEREKSRLHKNWDAHDR
jgi:hypothetical protein